MAAPVASTLLIDDAIRKPLTALARSQKAPHRLVVRARIVLAAADGVSNAVIARMLSLSEDTVRTWRGRFIAGGIAGLADRRRPGRPPRYGPQVHLPIAATVTGERPEADSVWTHRLIAERLADVGISASQIGRILADLDLKPHRVRGWLTRPGDAGLFTKATAVCDLYLHKPAGSIVVCVDEKTAIGARSRKYPEHRAAPGRVARRESGYMGWRHPIAPQAIRRPITLRYGPSVRLTDSTRTADCALRGSSPVQGPERPDRYGSVVGS
jgi:transposase